MNYLLSFLGMCIIYSCVSTGDTKKRENEFMIKAKGFSDKELWDSAIYYNKKALELNDSVLYLSNIGVLYNMQNMPEKAIIYLDSAIKLYPNDAPIYFNRAESYSILGSSEKAINDLEKALKIDPNLYDAKVGLSKLYYDQDKYELAIKYLNEMIIREPQNDPYKFHRGKSNLYLYKYSEAIKDFNDLLLKDSSNFKALIARAEAYTGLNQYDSSINDYKKAVAINPTQKSTSYRNLAEIYLMVKKNKNKACEYIHLDAKLHNKTEISKEDLQKYCGK